MRVFFYNKRKLQYVYRGLNNLELFIQLFEQFILISYFLICLFSFRRAVLFIIKIRIKWIKNEAIRLSDWLQIVLQEYFQVE